jgi:hypothetical protein
VGYCEGAIPDSIRSRASDRRPVGVNPESGVGMAISDSNYAEGKFAVM